MIRILEEAVQTFETWEELLNYLILILPAITSSLICITINWAIRKIKSSAENALDNNQLEVKEAKRLIRDMQIECEKKDEQIREYQRMVKKCCDKIDDGE